MARDWRVHHDAAPGEAGAELALAPDEAHHVRRVLRLAPGEALRVFDGRGREWEAVLTACDRERVLLRLGAECRDRVEAPLSIELFQGSCRAERMDWVVQKATEIGAAAIHPLRAEREERAAGGRARGERWRRIALEAVKQSGRRRLPDLEPVERPPSPTPEVLAIVLDPAAGEPLGRLLERQRPRPVWIAIGPEAGFSDAERLRFAEAGWLPAGLGPRILRTETAGLVAAALVLARWGDLGA